MIANRIVPVLLVGAVACGGDDPPDGPALVTLTFDDATFVAFRDGDGEWIEVESTDGVFTAETTSGRYGWWAGCFDGSSGRNVIRYRTTSEGTELDLGACAATAVLPVVVSGTILGVAEDDAVDVWSLDSSDLSVAGTYSVGVTTDKPAQLLAVLLDDSFNPLMALRDELGVLTADTTHDLDFAANGQPVSRVPVELAGGQADDSFFTYTGVVVGDDFMYPLLDSPDVPSLPELPAALQRPDDRFDVGITAERLDGAVGDRRTVGELGPTIPRALELPAAKSFGDAIVTEAPFSIAWTLPAIEADGPDGQISAFWFASGAGFTINSVTASPAWAAETDTLDVVEPAGLAAELATRGTVSWTIEEVRGDLLAAWTSAGSSGSLEVPAGARRPPATRRDRQRAHAEVLRMLRARRR